MFSLSIISMFDSRSFSFPSSSHSRRCIARRRKTAALVQFFFVKKERKKRRGGKWGIMNTKRLYTAKKQLRRLEDTAWVSELCQFILMECLSIMSLKRPFCRQPLLKPLRWLPDNHQNESISAAASSYSEVFCNWGWGGYRRRLILLYTLFSPNPKNGFSPSDGGGILCERDLHIAFSN